MTLSRLRDIVLLVLIVGFATTAWAGTNLYRGSLIIQAYGNDTTDGTIYPMTQNVFLGHPFGITCNPDYGPGTKVCGQTTPEAQAGSPLTGSASLSLTGTGPAAIQLPQSGLSRVIGTPATQFHVGTGKWAIPIPNRCHQQTPSNTKGFPTSPTPGCGIPGGSFSAYYPYIYSYSYASLKNAQGSFFGGGGPGALDWKFKVGNDYVANVVVKQGANRFGGTMQLLGHFYSYGAYAYAGGLSVGSWNWLFTKVGGAGVYGTGKVTPTTQLVSPGTTTTTFTLYNTVAGGVVTSTVKAQYVGWTTGTVTITAKRGEALATSHQQRKGYDTRNPQGQGNIQLVSPLLTHWFGSNNIETTGVGILKIFVPEPAEWMLLAGGVSMLGLIYRAKRRSG